MTTMLTSRLMRMLMREVTPARRDDPIERERGSTYVRFDCIEISNVPGARAIEVKFRFGGITHVVLREDGLQLANGDALVISGIEGRQRITLDGA